MFREINFVVLWTVSVICSVSLISDARPDRDQPTLSSSASALVEFLSDPEIFKCPFCFKPYSFEPEANCVPITMCCGYTRCTGCYSEVEESVDERQPDSSTQSESIKYVQNKTLMDLIDLREHVWGIPLSEHVANAVWVMIYEILQCSKCFERYEEEGGEAFIDAQGVNLCETCVSMPAHPTCSICSEHQPHQAKSQVKDQALNRVVRKARSKMDPDSLPDVYADIGSCVCCNRQRLRIGMHACQINENIRASYGSSIELLTDADVHKITVCNLCMQKRRPTSPQTRVQSIMMALSDRLSDASRVIDGFEERAHAGEESPRNYGGRMDEILGSCSQAGHRVLLRQLLGIVQSVESIKTGPQAYQARKPRNKEARMGMLRSVTTKNTAYVVDKTNHNQSKIPVINRMHFLPEGIKREYVRTFLNPRMHYSVASNGRFIYVIGGGNEERACLNPIEVYDTLNDRVFTTLSLSVGRHFCSATCFNGHLYVAGGGDVTSAQNPMGASKIMHLFDYIHRGVDPAQGNKSVEVFAIGEDGDLTRKGECELTETRIGGSFYEHENSLYLIGGFVGLNRKKNGVVDSKYVEKMVVREDGKRTWKKLSKKLAMSKAHCGCIFYDNRLFMVGGWRNMAICESVFSYCPETGVLETNEPPLKMGRRNPALFVHDGALYAMYGCGSDFKQVDSVEKLSIVDGRARWSMVNVIQ